MAAPMLVHRVVFVNSRSLQSFCSKLNRGTVLSVKRRILPRHCSPCMSSSNFTTHTDRHGQETHNMQSFNWISKEAPRFAVSGQQIRVLEGPVQYFETIKSKIKGSQRRIVLASLYLGTGPHEDELVSALFDVCRSSLSPINVRILLDCTRGSRGERNSRTMLLPLLKAFPSSVEVALYHTPDLRGGLKRLIPERYNEVIGLSHLKVCLFDDTLLISGANLSDSYFTNRQDRYVIIEDCPQLANFFAELVAAVSSFSFRLTPDDTLTLDPEVNIHPYKGDVHKFKNAARHKIQAVLDPQRWEQGACSRSCNQVLDDREMMQRRPKRPQEARESLGYSVNSDVDEDPRQSRFRSRTDSGHRETESSAGCNPASIKLKRTTHEQQDQSQSARITHGQHDTVVYPLVQMGCFGVRSDQKVTGQLLRSAEEDSRCVLASGYFNLTKEYMGLVLGAKADYKILTASPKANGFYGAKGISGHVPDAYTFIARNFLRRVCRRRRDSQITMHEYHRDGWTFHVKGLWYYLRGQALPSLTLIGSPNFGHRSVHRDLEAQLAIVTTNEGLRRQLHQEQQRFFERSVDVSMATFKTKERRVPLWARIFTLVARNFF